MTKYEKIVQKARRRAWVFRDGDNSCVYIDGLKSCVYGRDEPEKDAIARCNDIRAALIADMCKVANVKPPKARKR